GDARVTVHAMALPPERAAGRILGDNADAVPELVRLLQTEAKVL
ncbi:MAG: electron transfer flavoprotein subunit beta, partial [Gemmatimonadota bacterium]|nr:electron transfer flavoprotein subunit beta [Gemmatimonadota bacterium]